MRYLLTIIDALKPGRVPIANTSLFIGLFVLLPYITNPVRLLLELLIFFIFYGAIYFLNDIADYKQDKQDPNYHDRTLVAGKLGVQEAKIVTGLILLLTLVVMWLFAWKLFWLALLFLCINIGYSWGAKAIPYLDILFISVVHPLKYVLAFVVCNIAFHWTFVHVMFMVCVYFISVFFQSDKQLKKVQRGVKRPFLFGVYSILGLTYVGDVALVLAVAAVPFLYGTFEFWGAAALLVFAVYFRFLRGDIGIFRKWKVLDRLVVKLVEN